MLTTTSGPAFCRALRPMLAMAAPLVLAELGWMAMGLVDTVMVGHMPDAAVPLSAASLAQVFYNTFAFGIGGVLLGLDTVIAQAHGAGAARREFSEANRWFLQGIVLSIALAFVMIALTLLAPFGMRRLPIDATVLVSAIPALRALSWGTLPLMLAFALRRHLQAFNHGRWIAAALVSANLVNLLFDWLLIFPHRWQLALGDTRLHAGWDGLGVVGSSYATSLARCYLAAFFLAALWVLERRYHYGLLRKGWSAGLYPHLVSLRRLVGLGLPSGATIFVEILIFATVTAVIGMLGPVPLAGHEIALNCISFTFMVPLGISAAASVRVGQAIGRGAPVEAKAAGWAAIALGAVAMTITCVTYLSFPRAIASLFTAEPAVIAATLPLLAIAAVFQFCDGLQVTAIGALRGAGDTTSGLVTHLCSYWLLGMPLGLWLCFHRKLGARGLWLGLSTALILSGLILLGRWRSKRLMSLMGASGERRYARASS